MNLKQYKNELKKVREENHKLRKLNKLLNEELIKIRKNGKRK